MSYVLDSMVGKEVSFLHYGTRKTGTIARIASGIVHMTDGRWLHLQSILDTFTQAYLECALWSSTGEDCEPLDNDYGIEDIANECIAQAMADCQDFQTANADDLAEMEASQAGHDFWLTRNGHGAGFWDRGLGELGQRLTDASKVYGSVYLYVGDDGKIYCQ